jgi:peptidyl-dipeptidase Dcp
MSEEFVENKELRENPFLVDYNTPHDTVPFDRIKMEDYEPAFMEGIRRENEQIEKIINNPDEPTFENTLIYEDKSRPEDYYDLLSKVSSVFFNLMSAETNDDMEALAQKMQPILTKHANDISLNPKMFERIHYVFKHEYQKGENKKLLKNAYEGFVRSGALLNEEDKNKMRQITDEASALSLKFSQNLLKENKAFILHITDEKQLEGLPVSAREAAALAAKERGMDGWVITLDYPSYSPFMTYSTQEDLRKQLYMARNTMCTHDNESNNIEICKRLINLRMELAQLLGYKNFAAYVLKRRMAGKAKTVNKLLNDLIVAYTPTALKERNDLIKMAKGLTHSTNYDMQPWDTAYYTHKLQMEKYNLDAEMLRPYFELSHVIDGVFGLANKLYGITFKENKDIPVYHPDVKAYEVFDKDGSYLAVFYADFFPRQGKQGGAWMTEYQGQWIDRKGKNVRPHVSVVMNLTKPTAEKPALLTLGEVETFLHEFGHSLHGMFANTKYESMSGTNVEWDFVEFPSQFMENFAIEKDFLNTFAFHYQTGEAIPDELIERIHKSRNFMVANACLRQVSFGLLDMAYYTRNKPFDGDLMKFEKKAWKKAIIDKQLPNTCMTVQFSHIMAGGYAAGYYSYKWAEVLDADAFSLFKEEGIFNQELAQRLRDCVLSKGGTENPMKLYREFRQGNPTIDALLKRNGIKNQLE